MLHEYLQTDIVREDGLTRTRSWGAAIHSTRHVRRTGVELGQQETSLRASLVTDNVTWDGETVNEQVLDKAGQVWKEKMKMKRGAYLSIGNR